MLTLLLIAFPLLSAGLVFLAGSKLARTLALGSSLIQLLLTGVAAWLLQSGGNTALLEWNQEWIGPLGMNYSFQLDGISMVLALLNALVTPLIIYASFNRSFRNPHVFYGLILLMTGAMLGAFAAGDAMMFYIFYEFALIPIYFIILIWSDNPDKLKITLRFFLYTLFGSLFMLLSLLYVKSEAASFSWEAMYTAGRSLSAYEQGWVFAGIFVAFAVKIPVFPFHTWQPSTYDAAPTAGTMLLGGIMLKMATYGLIRMVVPMVPTAVNDLAGWAFALCSISIVYASLMAIAQKRYKLLIAYSSVAHVGLIAAGVMSGTPEGIQGGLFEMVSHAVIGVGLFFVYDVLHQRYHHDEIAKMGGIRSEHPLFAFLFFAIVMASVALPFTSGFVGEFLLILGFYQYSPWMAAAGGLTVILGAVYMLRAFQVSILGDANATTASFTPLTKQETVVLTLVVVFTVVLGIYPAPLLELSSSSVSSLLLGIR
jgi:NADH-quinone oxidoreductase subunit M